MNREYKSEIYDLMVKEDDILRSFAELGEGPNVSPNVAQSISRFTCQLFGQKGTPDINQA